MTHQHSPKHFPRRCIVEDRNKVDCGYPGIPREYCLAAYCCYDNTTTIKGVAWCYKSSTDNGLTKAAIVLLARDGVPFDVLSALYVEKYPGSEWLLAFKDGKIDTKRLLLLVTRDRKASLNPFVGDILAGKNPLDRVLDRAASAAGLDRTTLDLLIDKNYGAVLRHLIALAHAKNNNTYFPAETLNRLLSGKKDNLGVYMVNYYTNIVLPYDQKGNPFRDAFYRSLFAGKVEDAIMWSYLYSIHSEYPQEAFYPNNTRTFVGVIEEFQNKTDKFNRTEYDKVGLGINNEFHKGSSFEDVFGEKATDYVCENHPEYLQIPCQKLYGRVIVTREQCYDAGCCLEREQRSKNGRKRRRICFENYLGNIGLRLAFSDETTEDMYNFFRFARKNFIPWIPNNRLPEAFENFVDSGNTNPFDNFFPTLMPIGPHPLRPDFVWKPHAPTAFPAPTRLPNRFLVPTDGSLIINEPDIDDEEKGILTFGFFEDECEDVEPEDRFPCIDNSVALTREGEDECDDLECCFQPDYRNLSIPACFRRREYGQCYKVKPQEREECGFSGINRTTCLENPQCCYDSTVSLQSLYSRVPWCYYKKNEINYVVNRKSCVEVKGCCYEKFKLSALDRIIGIEEPPPCFKGLG
uniref:uncharacterized protein LOC120325914 n=1 Tax=Styela clava TaxID=7725 RepID=UPI001939C441|nr:uncharacterized protein LOC120325914 [Styela clava]